jgi:16S rRNA pseudouridine516 synthase
LLNKPAGVITAGKDVCAQTVMDCVPKALSRRKVLPVGRLDKDTTGLLLLTNDGELAHRLLSPKRRVIKEYHAHVEGRLDEDDVLAFARGIALPDCTAKGARMRILSASPAASAAALWLEEGKYHQAKRMFAACGHKVLTLRRVAFGPLRLPDDLPGGACRELTPAEVAALREAVQLL